MILFLDANVLIYLLEGKEPFSRQAAERIAGLRRYHPDLALAVSRLSWLERCRRRAVCSWSQSI